MVLLLLLLLWVWSLSLLLLFGLLVNLPCHNSEDWEALSLLSSSSSSLPSLQPSWAWPRSWRRQREAGLSWIPFLIALQRWVHPIYSLSNKTNAHFVSSSTSSIMAFSCISSTIKNKEKNNGTLSFRVRHVHDSVFHDFGELFPFVRSLCILHHPWDELHTLVFVVRLIRLVLAFYYFPVVHKEI